MSLNMILLGGNVHMKFRSLAMGKFFSWNVISFVLFSLYNDPRLPTGSTTFLCQRGDVGSGVLAL